MGYEYIVLFAASGGYDFVALAPYMKGRHRDMTLALVWFLLTVAALLLSQGSFAGDAVQMLFYVLSALFGLFTVCLLCKAMSGKRRRK